MINEETPLPFVDKIAIIIKNTINAKILDTIFIESEIETIGVEINLENETKRTLSTFVCFNQTNKNIFSAFCRNLILIRLQNQKYFLP